MEDRTIEGWGADTAPVTQERETYWSSFYAAESSSKMQPPSQFAAFVAQELEPEGALFEVGCGSGRDSLFFAALGFKVLALDRSEEAIRTAKIKAEQNALSNLRFICDDIAGPSFSEALDGLGTTSACLYARFFLHAITEEEQRIFFEKLSVKLKPGHKLALEYRTTADQFLEKDAPPHFRRYQDAEAVNAALKDLGFCLLYAQEGQGFAKYNEEDAIVARALFKKA